MDEKRVELWLKLGQFFIGTVGIGLVTIYINYQIQEREVEIKEMEMLGKFVEHAINDNVAVRQRFAEYFSTVSRSTDIRSRWASYKVKVDDEFQKKEQIAAALKQQKEEEEKRVETLRQQLAEAKRKEEELNAQLELKSHLAESKIQELEKEKQDQQKILQEVQVAVFDRDSKLANLQAQLQDAKADITYPEKRVAQQQLPKSGWVYLGEFDKSKNTWIKSYVNVGRSTNPESLKGETIQVTANAINVRASGDPWSKVLDVMKSNAFLQVEEIDEWGSTGYFWARVTYY